LPSVMVGESAGINTSIAMGLPCYFSALTLHDHRACFETRSCGPLLSMRT